jgi:hypothetical protein
MVDRNMGIDQAFKVCRTEESKLQAFEQSLSENPNVSNAAIAAHLNTLKEELLRQYFWFAASPACRRTAMRRRARLPWPRSLRAGGWRREYQPRIIGGKVMLQADLERPHKYMREFERVEAISDEMRAVVESEWPELAHKPPPKENI